MFPFLLWTISIVCREEEPKPFQGAAPFIGVIDILPGAAWGYQQGWESIQWRKHTIQTTRKWSSTWCSWRRLCGGGPGPFFYSPLVQTRVIDGQKYLLIPAGEGVEFNGLAVRIPAEREENPEEEGEIK